LTSLDRELSELRSESGDQNGNRQGAESGQGQTPGRVTGRQAGQQNGQGIQRGGVGQDTGATGTWEEARELLNELRQSCDGAPDNAREEINAFIEDLEKKGLVGHEA